MHPYQFHVLTRVKPAAVSVSEAVDYISAQAGARRLSDAGLKAGVLVTTSQLRELARRSCNGAVAIAIDGEAADPFYEPLYELADGMPAIVGGFPLLDAEPAGGWQPEAAPAPKPAFVVAPPPAVLAMPPLATLPPGWPGSVVDWNRPSVLDRLAGWIDWAAAKLLAVLGIPGGQIE